MFQVSGFVLMGQTCGCIFCGSQQQWIYLFEALAVFITLCLHCELGAEDVAQLGSIAIPTTYKQPKSQQGTPLLPSFKP